MKNKRLSFVLIPFFILIFSVMLMSKDGKQVGKIGSVSASKEIIVNIESGKTIKMV